MRLSELRPIRFAAALLLLGALSACAGDLPDPAASTNGAPMTADPDRPPESMTDLPADKAAARVEVRKRLVAQWSALLDVSELRYESAAFGVDPAYDDERAVTGSITVAFGQRPQSEWPDVEGRMTAAAARNGWGQAGVSHGMNLRKGAFLLRGGCGVANGCVYTVETSNLTQDVLVDVRADTLRVEELEKFRDPAAPLDTPTG